MLNVDKSRLTKEMLKDIEEYEKTGEDAIFLLAKQENDYRDIITRMQSSNILFVANSGVKTLDDWNNNGMMNCGVNEKLVALNNDNGKLKYSCYALKAPTSYKQGLRLPFVDSYASKKRSLFAGNNKFSTYSSLLEKISSVYKIKIKEVDSAKKHIVYKKGSKFVSMLKDKTHRVLNLCRKFLRKEQKVAPIRFKGKLSITKNLSSVSKSRYEISQQEKFTEILDKIILATAKHFAKNDKLDLTEKEMLVATLYADILMSRAINYGDVKNNTDIENALKLQLSNVLATLEPSKSKLKQLTNLGMKSAIYNLQKMGISVKEVVDNAKACGFTYSSEPTTYEDALLGSKLKLQEMQANNIVEQKDNNKNKEQETKNNIAADIKKSQEEKNTKKDNEYSYTPSVDADSIANYYTNVAKLGNYVINIPNESTKKEVELTQKSARKYVDTIVMKAFKNYMAKSVVVMSGYSNKTGKVYAKMQRRHLFIEDMLAYYEANKSLDMSQLVIELTKMIEQNDNSDALQACKFGNSLLSFREAMISSIFKDAETMKKENGETIATLVNKYLKENYNATSLTPFVNNMLKVSMKDIDKLSKPNTFESER